MMLYNIIASVQWWCIFILSTQRADCASFFSNAESTGIGGVTLPSLCSDSDPSEQYVSDKGAASSLVLSLRPEHGRTSSSASSCKRQFRAPDAYNFFVRLQRIPGASGTRGASSSRKYSSSTKSGNTTNSCALTISQSANGEVLPSWRLDPCALESAATAAATTPEDQMRLLQGKLNIVWKHDGNAPNYRLHITVVGQGNVCLEREKHSCLAYAGMPLLCIASELICDGVPNCPPLGSDVSDENEEMCAKHRQEVLSENPVQSVFRKYIQNTLKSFFGGEPDDLPSEGLVSSDAELSLRFPPPPSTPAPAASGTATETATATAPAKKHRSSLTGLSKYGPWGYLFLGMLICGGALLICGLWECCCRSHKREQSPDDSLAATVVPSFLQTSSPGDVGSGANGGGPIVPSLNLPQYAELDPPPAYSVLFPNQKPSDDTGTGPTSDDGDEGTMVPASGPPAPASLTVANDAIAITNGSTVTGGSQSTAGTAEEAPPALEVASPQQPITLLPAHSSSSSPA